TTHPPALYGDGWAQIAPEHTVASWLDNAELPRLYSSAAIVLNDHWPDMRAAGFISNRVFDALACGAFVVSDPVEGLREELGDAVETDIGDLQRTFDRWLADPAERRRRAAAGREIVLRHHTADVRAGELLELLAATMPGFPCFAAETVQ
ncbi:MAG: hypothetical protein QOE28_403, partial [Solirubrobacteraceae bacterium]|nr:hypothetical protein [Solirubrobacteraceae bacterium]